MIAWLLYLTAFGLGVGVAALLAERGLRRLGLPVRGVWAVAMAMTVALPLGSAFMESARPTSLDVWARVPGYGSFGMTDAVVIITWIVMSMVMLANVRLSAWTVRRNERSWRGAQLGDRPLLVSAGFGPGVVGAVRPRIVIPQWVVGAAPSLRRLIMLHEVEHVRARDTRLLLAGVMVVALVPLCLPLWWQLHRLRGAMETDCDARVLAAEAEPREYANALLAVAAAGVRTPMPVPALGPRGAELERRIRLITAGTRSRSKPRGLGLLAVAVAMLLGLAMVPAPQRPTVSAEGQPAAPGVAPRVIVLFSIPSGP